MKKQIAKPQLTELEKVKNSIRDMKTTLLLHNLYHWNKDYKVDEEENRLYHHLYLIPTKFDFIPYVWLKTLESSILKYSSSLFYTISIVIRQTEVVSDDHRCWRVQVPSVDIQISLPNE